MATKSKTKGKINKSVDEQIREVLSELDPVYYPVVLAYIQAIKARRNSNPQAQAKKSTKGGKNV